MKKVFLYLIFFSIQFAFAQQTTNTCSLRVLVYDGLSSTKPASHYILLISNSGGEAVYNRYVADTSSNLIELPVGDSYQVLIGDAFFPPKPSAEEGSIDLRSGCNEYDDTIWVHKNFHDQSVDNYLIFFHNLMPPVCYFKRNSLAVENQDFQIFLDYINTINVLLTNFDLSRSGLFFDLRGCQEPGEKEGMAINRATELKKFLISTFGLTENQFMLSDLTPEMLKAAAEQNIKPDPSMLRFVTIGVMYKYHQ